MPISISILGVRESLVSSEATRNSPFPLKLHEEQRPCKHITETTGDVVHTRTGKWRYVVCFRERVRAPGRFRFIVNFPWPAGNVAAVDENVGGKRRVVGVERKKGGKKKGKGSSVFFFFPNKTCGFSA